MTVAKKVLAIALAAALFSTFLFSFCALGGDMPKRLTPVTPPWQEGQATMEQLQDFFPHGLFWNHVVGDEDEAYSVTDTACSPYTDDEDLHDKEAGVTCNYFEIPGKVWGGWQCCGYTRLLTYSYYGSSFENWETAPTLQNVKVGDVLYLWNYGPHYIWILSLKQNGDGTASITYADCNGTGKRSHCQIQWDALGTLDLKNNTMKNPLLGDWELQKLYASPEKPAPTTTTTTTVTTTTTTQPPTTTTIPTTTTTQPPSLAVTYNLCGGEAGNKQYTVDKTGALCVWETGEPVVDRFAADGAAMTALLSAERLGAMKEGYLFAGWSLEKDGGAAASQLAAVYPLSAAQSATWLREQLCANTQTQLQTAMKNGSRRATVYAVWIPDDKEETE